MDEPVDTVSLLHSANPNDDSKEIARRRNTSSRTRNNNPNLPNNTDNILSSMSIASPIAVLGAEGENSLVVSSWNDTLSELTGIEEDEMIG